MDLPKGIPKGIRSAKLYLDIDILKKVVRQILKSTSHGVRN